MGRDRLNTSKIKHNMLSVHTAVLEGIAVFFCSTYSLPIPISPPIYTQFFRTSASALQRVRFFVVGKRLFLTFYRSRAPPSSLGFSISKISGLEENEVKIKYEFVDGTVSEVEVEESIGAVIIEDKRFYSAFHEFSEVQRRRLLMLAGGMSVREIARQEGVDFRTVHESIAAGRKKFKKLF